MAEGRDEEAIDDAILEALASRPVKGMTVFELRNRVCADIHDIESALEQLKAANRITIDRPGDRLIIRLSEQEQRSREERAREPTLIERIIERLT